MLFHSEQSPHCPCQRLLTEPQAWQTYRLRGFAIAEELDAASIADQRI
jgi:hypothetical protein